MVPKTELTDNSIKQDSTKVNFTVQNDFTKPIFSTKLDATKPIFHCTYNLVDAIYVWPLATVPGPKCETYETSEQNVKTG